MKKDIPVYFHIEKERYNELKDFCELHNITKSELIRNAIYKYIRNTEDNKDTKIYKDGMKDVLIGLIDYFNKRLESI